MLESLHFSVGELAEGLHLGLELGLVEVLLQLLNQILAFMSELAYLQLLGFVLSPQYFDSPDRLALQKDGGSNFFFGLTARVDQFT